MYTSIKIKSELKRYILNFGYGIIYKYEGMLAYSFDRFYVVTKFILHSTGDFHFSRLDNNNTCTYLDDRNICNADTKNYLLDLLVFCKKFEPHVTYYKRQIKSHNNTAHNILKSEIDLTLPQYLKNKNMVSSFIGLPYKGISSFMHTRRNKALNKAVKAMDSKTTIQHNKSIQLRELNAYV